MLVMALKDLCFTMSKCIGKRLFFLWCSPLLRQDVPQDVRLPILLALMEWAGRSFNKSKMDDLKVVLRSTEWIPTADG